MRLAALYDIHANLPALDAILAEVRRERVDLVVVGGDVVPGPMARDTLERLLNLEVPVQFIHGNGERVVAAQHAGGDVSEVPEVHRDVIRWTAQQLTPDHHRQIASWPPTCQIAVDGLGEVLFCHATPRNDSECFTRLTPEVRLLPVFATVTAPTIVCGHTHMPFDRRVGAHRVVNAGSVGQPFASPAGAYWLLLGPDIQLRCTPYAFAAAADQMRATGMPLVETLSVRYVLQPPTEAESLAMFAPVELP